MPRDYTAPLAAFSTSRIWNHLPEDSPPVSRSSESQSLGQAIACATLMLLHAESIGASAPSTGVLVPSARQQRGV